MLIGKLRETLFFAFIGVVLTGALWRAFSGNSDSSALEGDTRTQIILAILYGSIGLFCVVQYRWTLWLLQHSPALTGLLFLACVSPLWAETPNLVFRRSISLLGTSLFGVLLASRLTFSEQLRVARLAFRITAVACLVLFVVAPSHAMGADYGTGTIRGIFPHKNLFGAAMALGFLVEWFAFDEGAIARVIKFTSLGLFSGLLVVSRSVTSIVTVGATLLILWLFEKFHRRYHIPLPAILIFVAGLIVCVALFGIDTSIFTDLMGRSKDLSGRTDLWHSVGSMIMAKPLLGYGFSGFWEGASIESYAVEQYVGWSPTYSHNGYLEILLNLGTVGGGLFLIFLWKGLSRTVHLAEERSVKEELWPLAFLVFFVVHNCAEATIIWQNCFEWSLLIATVVSADPAVHSVMIGESLRAPLSEPSDDFEDPFVREGYARHG